MKETRLPKGTLVLFNAGKSWREECPEVVCEIMYDHRYPVYGLHVIDRPLAESKMHIHHIGADGCFDCSPCFFELYTPPVSVDASDLL